MNELKINGWDIWQDDANDWHTARIDDVGGYAAHEMFRQKRQAVAFAEKTDPPACLRQPSEYVALIQAGVD